MMNQLISTLVRVHRAVTVEFVVQMEIVTRVVVCLISLEIHLIANLNAFGTQNVPIIWLA